MSKWLGNMNTKELGDIAIQFELIKVDDMAQDLGVDEYENVRTADQVQGDINNSKEWRCVKREGSDGLYPLSKAIFENHITGERIRGMLNEATGDKLIGEIVQ